MPSQKLATADEIRQVALAQFAQNGYEATSMREIAGGVGIKAASLYNHFGSKEAILWDLTCTALTSLTLARDEALAKLPAKASARERLSVFIRTHVRFHAENSHQAMLVNSQMTALSGPHFHQAVELRDAYQSEMQIILRAGKRSGEFSYPDLDLTSYAILQMGIAVSMWYRPEGRLRVGQVCDVYAELAERLVCARDPGSD